MKPSSNTMADSDIIYESDIDDTPKKKCNWCNTKTKLAPNKPYCYRCNEGLYRECSRCHRPYPSEKYFEKNDTRCNSCQEKYLREKEKRQQKKIAIKNDKELASSDDDNSVKKRKVTEQKIDQYFPSKKKRKISKDANTFIIKNRKKKYLVIYETDDCSD